VCVCVLIHNEGSQGCPSMVRFEPERFELNLRPTGTEPTRLVAARTQKRPHFGSIPGALATPPSGRQSHHLAPILSLPTLFSMGAHNHSRLRTRTVSSSWVQEFSLPVWGRQHGICARFSSGLWWRQRQLTTAQFGS